MPAPLPLPLVDGVLYIDNTCMELFNTCPRQAYYYKVLKKELNKSRIALDFGKAFHEVLDYLYRKYGTSYRNAEANSDILRYAQSLHLDTPDDDYRSNAYLVGAVSKYLSDYPAESFSLATAPDGKPAIEIPFARPLGIINSPVFGRVVVVWTGRIDLVYRQPGRLGIIDHKTTSMMGPQYFAEFDLSNQFYGYAEAAEFIFGEQISEVTVNGLGCRKPSVKGTGKQYEFARHIVPISRSLLAEWKLDALAAITSFIRCAEDGYFPKYTKWCVNKYGPCQYRAICTLNPEHREAALSTSEYRDVLWNPLDKST